MRKEVHDAAFYLPCPLPAAAAAAVRALNAILPCVEERLHVCVCMRVRIQTIRYLFYVMLNKIYNSSKARIAGGAGGSTSALIYQIKAVYTNTQILCMRMHKMCMCSFGKNACFSTHPPPAMV